MASPLQRWNSEATLVEHPGPVLHTRRTENPREIDLRATLSHAALNYVVPETGTLRPRLSDLHEKVRDSRSGIRYLFLIDSSESHAAQDKDASREGRHTRHAQSLFSEGR